MQKLLPLLYLVLFSSAMSRAQAHKNPGDLVPLDQVINQVQAALDEYQNNLGQGKPALPPLSSAEFDFKTTTGTTVSGGITLFIFKFGVSREKDVVNDVIYKYSPKPPPSAGSQLESSRPPPSLKDELAQTIQSAAKTVAASTTAAGLPFSQLTVNLQYGVKWDVNASGSPQISFITVNLGADRSKNTVQSVKIVFGK